MKKYFGDRVFIAGICGISMSALALMLKGCGIKVLGADINRECKKAKELESLGISVVDPTNLNAIADFNPTALIYSVAIKTTDAEIVWAKEHNVKVMCRGEALGYVVNKFKNLIAVSGSHGKTTTTALITNILKNSNIDFSAHIGGQAIDIGGNVQFNRDSDTMVVEACEYFDSFLWLLPTIAVILNVQCDHLDYFKSEENLKNSFVKFAENVRSGGCVIVNLDDEGSQYVMQHISSKRIWTFSLYNTSANIYVDSFQKLGDGTFNFSVVYEGRKIDNLHLNAVGEHNLYNALASVLVAKILGIDENAIKRGLDLFGGVKRRYERLGEINGVKIIHDYAHHPEELHAVIEETKSNIKDGRLFVVFESHTYSRTKALFDKFAECLKLAYRAITLPIYPAREFPIEGISGETLATRVNELGGACYFMPDYNSVKLVLSRLTSVGDVVLLLGAGNIDKLGDFLIKEGW